MDPGNTESLISSSGIVDDDYDESISFYFNQNPNPNTFFDPDWSNPSTSFSSFDQNGDVFINSQQDIHSNSNSQSTLLMSSNTNKFSTKSPKKRSRTPRKGPRKVVKADTTNFRQMVHEFTGITVSVPMTASTYSRLLPDSGFEPLRPSIHTYLLSPSNIEALQKQSQSLVDLQNPFFSQNTYPQQVNVDETVFDTSTLIAGDQQVDGLSWFNQTRWDEVSDHLVDFEGIGSNIVKVDGYNFNSTENIDLSSNGGDDAQATSGPRNPELLWLQQQQKHRSYSIFNNTGNDGQLKVKRCDLQLFRHIRENEIPPQVLHHIQEAGFGGVIQCSHRKVDQALITALVERWRPETHTFHLPVGEATVTLQDVQVLWGLPIDGPLVSGIAYSRNPTGWVNRCEELLGFSPKKEHIDYGKITVKRLVEHLDHPLQENDIAYQQRARIYILALLGSTLFADASFHTVPLMYLDNLIDLSRAGRLSWGSAVIASLYRNLCNATTPGEVGTQGPLLLLQYWAWDRIPNIAPQIITKDGYKFQEPYAGRWNYYLGYKEIPAGELVVYRTNLTALQPGEFIWTPYDDIIPLLPACCKDGAHIWTYNKFVIFWQLVEQHLPNRVARQFGYAQGIPSSDMLLSPADHSRMHNLTRHGHRNTNWIQKNAEYITYWNDRVNNVFTGERITKEATTVDYMEWYKNFTVEFVTDPSQKLTSSHIYPDQGNKPYDEMSQVIQTTTDTMATQPEACQNFQPYVHLPTQLMQNGHVEQCMSYSSPNFNFHGIQDGNITDYSNAHHAGPLVGPYNECPSTGGELSPSFDINELLRILSEDETEETEQECLIAGYITDYNNLLF